MPNVCRRLFLILIDILRIPILLPRRSLKNISFPHEPSTRLESENLSFKEYLTRKRLENVLELIVLRSYKLYTACMDSGFKDLSTFYRNFRKFYGMSAREYINKFPDALPRVAKEEIKLESGTTIELYENGELKVKELARAYLDLVNSGASTTILDSTKYIDYSNSNHIPSD